MDYSGEICQIPLTGSLISDLATSQAPFNSLSRVYNCDFALGYIQKAPGAIQYNRNSFGSPVVAVLDYWPTITQQRTLVATANGNIYRDIGDRYFSGGSGFSNVSIAQNIGGANGILDNRCQFVVGGNEVAGNAKKVFFFTGGLNQVQVMVGDTPSFSAITNPSADWPNASISQNAQGNYPKFGLMHRGMLWCFAKSQAYASNTANHEDFQTSGATLINNVGPGEGGDIIAAFVYKQKLLVWKEGDYCYMLNDSSSTSSQWYFSLQGVGLGAAGWHSMTQVLDDLLIGNVTNKLTSFKATLNYGDFSQGDIYKQAHVAQFFAQNTCSIGNLYQQALFYPDRGIALYSNRTFGTQANNCAIQLDVSDPTNPRYGLWTHISPVCFSLRRDEYNTMRPIFGGPDGYVYLADREERSVGAQGANSAYTGEFWTQDLDLRHLDPKLAHQNKSWEQLGITFPEESGGQLSVDVWIDGIFRETVNFNQTVDTNYCGAFVLGQNHCAFGEKTIWQPIHGNSRHITLRCYNGAANQNFKVSMLSLGWRLSGEQATKL